MAKIKFGTDGWRDIIAQNFTFENLTKVAIATAKFYKKHKKIKNGIVIGYDTRFLSKEFAEHVATVIANFGVKVLLSDGYCPTPAVSLAIPKFNCAGGVVITASHNPYKYNGYKLKADYGGPEEVENIAKVEKEANKLFKSELEKVKKSFEQLKEKGLIEVVNLRKIYIDDLKTKIDVPKVEGNFAKLRGKLPWPVDNGTIVNRFGEQVHPILKTVTLNYGVDIAVPENSPVKAVADGVVSKIFWLPSFENLIILTHDGGFRTVYANLSDILVNEGETVKAGQVIGRSGDSFEGSIVHFEIWYERQQQNPELWLSKK